MWNSNTKKEVKLKASVEELVGPLLKRIFGGKGPNNPEIITTLSILLEAAKGLMERRQNCESELIGCFGAIEREIEENNNGEDSERRWAVLMDNLKALLEKEGVDFSVVSANYSNVSDQEKERNNNLLQISTKFEVGEPSNSNNQKSAGADSHPYLAYTRGLRKEWRYCVYSLRIFPENVILKKTLLIYWWMGMGFLDPIYDHFLDLFRILTHRCIVEPVHAKKHNQVTDQWTINSTFHRHLKQLPDSLLEGWLFKIGDPETMCDEMHVRAELFNNCLVHSQHINGTGLLNREQRYLISQDLRKLLSNDNYDIIVGQFGKWRCTDLESRDHIEVDDTDFLKKLPNSLRYLSLRGISRIERLPESIGKLPSLRILDLRACHNLEKLPQKPQSKRYQRNWFNFLIHLDISECYLLDYMPKWICELSNLEVLKGFVAGSVGKNNQSCRLRDLSRMWRLRKLSIRIAKNMDPEDARGLESMEQLSTLTVIWAINEDNNENDDDKIRTITFPKTLEKLDIRCYPEAEVVELNPTTLPQLKRLYIRGGKLSKIESGSGWKVLEILRLRFLESLEMEWSELPAIFTNLEYLEYEGCPLLKHFPINRSTWNMKKDPSFSVGADDSLKGNNSRGVQLKIIHKAEAPLERHEKKLILQLSGSFIRDRPGLSLVVVLDFSRSMEADNKLEKLKTAILFLINKLSYLDHFAIVIHYGKSWKKSKWQQITEYSRKKLEYIVNSLKADTEADCRISIFDGLRIGLNLLKYRLVSIQTKCIILVSGGMQNIDVADKAKDIDYGNVAVHTFGFDRDHDPMVLKSIAYHSRGGIYSDVRNPDNLTKAFAVCLAGHQSVAAQDLILTLKSFNLRASVGGYERYNGYLGKVMVVGIVTITLGDLYSGEVRKVLITLNLPAVDEEGCADVLHVFYSYKLSGEYFTTDPVFIDVKRTQRILVEPPQHWDIIAEETRLKIVEMIKEATTLADDKKMESAQAKIVDAKNFFSNVEIKICEYNESFGLLKSELQELMQMMESNESYTQQRAFAYSLLTSHYRQRTAARGDNIEEFLSFATPFTLEFLKQAEKFDADQSKALTPIDEDVE